MSPIYAEPDGHSWSQSVLTNCPEFQYQPFFLPRVLVGRVEKFRIRVAFRHKDRRDLDMFTATLFYSYAVRSAIKTFPSNFLTLLSRWSTGGIIIFRVTSTCGVMYLSYNTCRRNTCKMATSSQQGS